MWGVGVRAIVKGSVGYSYAASLDVDLRGVVGRGGQSGEGGPTRPGLQRTPKAIKLYVPSRHLR